MLDMSTSLGRRLRLLILPLVAALVWTIVVVEPASARHLRSRAFSIVDDTQPLVGVPDRIRCSVNGPTADYVCENNDIGFRQSLISRSNEPPGILTQNYGVDENATKVISPGSFRCTRSAGGTGLPGEWKCRAGDARFTLRDIAYAQDRDDPSIEYGLPCIPCVKQQP
jgi:hypothetical protein